MLRLIKPVVVSLSVTYVLLRLVKPVVVSSSVTYVLLRLGTACGCFVISYNEDCGLRIERQAPKPLGHNPPTISFRLGSSM